MSRMLVAFDLDGTLYVPGGVEDSKALDALADHLRTTKAVTVLATGRSLDETLALQPIMAQLPVEFIVANCGAQVYLRREGAFVHDPSFSCRPGNTIPDGVRSELSELFLSNELITLQEARHQFPGKLSFYLRVEALSRLRELIAKARANHPTYEYLISYNSADRGYHYFDIQSPKSTKLAALQFLAGTLMVEEEDVVYFGDNGNDLPCIRTFRRAVIIDTYLDELSRDTRNFDWARVVQLPRGGAAALLGALKEMKL